jgi:Putative prokaryotic signal transducing protein
MSGLVAIANFDRTSEAHILRGRLESEGIFAVVTGDDLRGPLGLMGGTIQVLVLESDIPKALEIKRLCDLQ